MATTKTTTLTFRIEPGLKECCAWQPTASTLHRQYVWLYEPCHSDLPRMPLAKQLEQVRRGRVVIQ